ncbi:MAG: DUF1573 domain-containing protein [Candidatus Omnitrophota bacterium]
MIKKVILAFVFLLLFRGAVFAQAPIDLKADIYSKLKCCACDMAFGPCGCKEAIEMKAYIEALIDSGVSKDDIFYKVAKKYSLRVILDERIKAKIEKKVLKEAGGKVPRIALETASFNFGDASKKKGAIRQIFKLYNEGNSNLVITNIRVSCDCVIASLKAGDTKSPDFGVMGARDSGWQAVIKPGKSAELEVTLDLAHVSMEAGKKEVRDIFITSNDPLNSQTSLRVEVDVKE